MNNESRETNWHFAPIRTHQEVCDEMIRRGDIKMTVQSVWYYEHRALEKLRRALRSYADES